jgi:hypothetical protein
MFRLFTIFVLWLLEVLLPGPALAHPMDLGQLNLSKSGDRIVATLTLHQLAANRFLSFQPKNPSLDKSIVFFNATLESSKPKMNELSCEYLTPELKTKPDDNQYLELQVVITCPKNMNKAKHLVWEFPFLKNANDNFQLMTTVAIDERPLTLIASRKQPRIEIGESSETFTGFVRMGMCHIGACFNEWQDSNGHFQIADGIDHIFFIIALVLAGGGLWNLAKTATGFTIGHSVTLALSTYKIIHIHSKWIEASIAFSIAYVAGRAFWSKSSAGEKWIVAGLFGIVHGLGFSSALQDLELRQSEVLTALIGFNVGVELGQCFFIVLLLSLLGAIHKISPVVAAKAQRITAFAICLTGLYWVYYRGFV